MIIYRCQTCEYRANTASDIQSHFLQNHSKQTDQMEVMKKRLKPLEKTSYASSNEKQLMKKRLKPGEIPFYASSTGVDGILQCNSCDYKTNIKHSMKRHFVKHHLQQFKCQDCGYKGHSQSDLLKHIDKVHTKSNLVAVQTSVQKKLDFGSSESNRISYICNLCFLVAPSPEILAKHKEYKHGKNVASM